MAIRLGYGREPLWVDVGHDVQLFCDAPTTMRVYAARGQAVALMAEYKQANEAVTAVGGRIEGAPDISDDEREQSALEAMFIIALGELVIRDWKNVLTEDGEAALAFDPALVSTLFEDETIASAFFRNYLQPLHQVSAEKNV